MGWLYFRSMTDYTLITLDYINMETSSLLDSVRYADGVSESRNLCHGSEVGCHTLGHSGRGSKLRSLPSAFVTSTRF